jgi:Acetyltransferase (GNAT) domain
MATNWTFPITIQPFRSDDWGSVLNLLTDLPLLYPGGAAWLSVRLRDVVRRRAACWLAFRCDVLAGIAIETPKGRRVRKLSTLFVGEAFRGRGIAYSLVSRLTRNWTRDELDLAYVTVDLRKAVDLSSVLWKFGFIYQTVEFGRYGSERDEVILSWKPGLFLPYSATVPRVGDLLIRRGGEPIRPVKPRRLRSRLTGLEYLPGYNSFLTGDHTVDPWEADHVVLRGGVRE